MSDLIKLYDYYISQRDNYVALDDNDAKHKKMYDLLARNVLALIEDMI